MDARFWIWAVFVVGAPSLLILDLLFLQPRDALSMRRDALIVAFWVSVGLTFGALVFAVLKVTKGLEYLTAYIVEYSLSMDNLFVFIIILTYFAVPREAHHRVIYLGILGAIILRGIFIFAGIELVEQVRWAFIPLGAVLLYAAVRLLRHQEREVQPHRVWLVRLARQFLKFSDTYQGSSFFIRKGGKLLATPLFLVILAIAGTDFIFAFDSVPTVLGITQDRLVAYSSNLFAVLGLRALFFLLAALMVQFAYLGYGLALILGFIAIKLMLKPFYIEIPTLIALGVVIGVLALSILASLLKGHLAPTSQKDAPEEKRGG